MNRQDYQRLRTWFDRHRDESPRARPGVAEELPATEPVRLLRGFQRLFWERDARERERVLHWVNELVPGEVAASFLKEVVTSEHTGLGEKKLALDLLRQSGEHPASRDEEALERAWRILADEFPVWARAAGQTDEGWAEGWRLFRDLPAALRRLLAREILAQHPAVGLSFLAFGLREAAGVFEEILEPVAESPEPEAAHVLRAAYRKAGSRTLRKAIKTLIHKRRVRGLSALDPEAEQEEGPAVWAPPVPPRPEGLLALPDSETRVVWVIRHQVPKGMLAFGGVCHDENGLVEFFLLDLSRRDAEKYRETVLQTSELTVVEADPAYCAFLLEEAYRKGGPRNEEEALLYREYRSLLKELVPTTPPEPPIHRVFAAQEETAVPADPLGETAGLLQLPRLQAWRMNPARLAPYLEKLQEISESRIIVHPLQKRERTEAYYREVARELLSDPAGRESWRTRIEDMAWILYQKGEGSEARRLFEVGRYLRQPEMDASRISFFTQLVRRDLESMLQQKIDKEKETPSLIVKP